MTAVSVSTGASFSMGPPRVLFEWPNVGTVPVRAFDVTSDGQHFLMVLFNDAVVQSARSQMTLVFNWFDELKRLVPN